ncbi:MAG: hypothetical protein JNL05_00625, partial [Flavobacteriales bacterium]|nr:hypothetical protein [Flavobacteriales bacterium]
MRRLLFPLGVALLGCDVKEPVPDRPVATSALVLVRPLGEVDARVVDSAAQAIRVVHGLRVMVAAPVTLPLEAWTNVRTPRYRADTLISWLRATKPDSVDLIVGVTDQDISITKYDAEGKVKEPVARYRDFGIYGLGYMGGP